MGYEGREVIDTPQGENGTTQAAEAVEELTSDERKWVAVLLSHSQVCALLTTPQDKAFAFNVQSKLSE